MKIIIPVAEIGSRLNPHTYMVPKVLIKAGIKSIIEHIIDDNAGIIKLLIDHSIIGRGSPVKGVSRHLNIGDSSEVNFA